jgi:hypothetical protein
MDDIRETRAIFAHLDAVRDRLSASDRAIPRNLGFSQAEIIE